MKFLIPRLCVAVIIGAAGDAFAVSTISVNSAFAAPGATVQIPVTLTTDTNVISLQFDLVYSTNYLTTGTPVGGDAVVDPSELIGSNEVSPGVRRVLFASFYNIPLTNGLLCYIPFTVGANAPDHDESLVLTNVLLVNPQADSVPTNVVSGTLSLVALPGFSAIYQTNAGIHLTLAGTTGRSYIAEAATNLDAPQWTPLQTNVAVNGVAEFDLGVNSTPARFFRAVVTR